MPPLSCVLTNERLANGKRKPEGECIMTKLAFGVVARCDVEAPRYTTYKKCRLSVCVECSGEVFAAAQPSGVAAVSSLTKAAAERGSSSARCA